MMHVGRHASHDPTEYFCGLIWKEYLYYFWVWQLISDLSYKLKAMCWERREMCSSLFQSFNQSETQFVLRMC